MMRRKELYVELHPETRNGATGGGHDQLRQVGEAAPRFTADTTAATGKSERAVQRDAELDPAQRAKQTARRKAIYVELHPDTAHGGDRKSDQVDNMSTRSFADATAELTGRDARTVRRDAERGEKIAPEVLDQIAAPEMSAA
jgi:hypothetical protein